MNRTMKFSVPAAAITLQTAGIDYLGAALYGIVPGCLEKKDLFLNSNEDFKNYLLNEWVLNPSHVIHNAMGSDLFLKAQIPLLAWYGYRLLKTAWKNRSHKLEDASKYGAYGTARESTKAEILDKKLFTTNINEDGTLLARYGNKPLIQTEDNTLNKNVAVFGGSGSGKTAGYMIPNIINTKEKSIVVTDPKGELYEKTAATKRKQGYKVKLINFSNMNHSDRYNPLDYIREEIDIRKIAFTLAANNDKQDFWDKATISFVSALISYVKYCLPKEQQHMRSVFNLLKMDESELEELFTGLPDNHIAKDSYYQAIHHLEGKTRSNVIISTSVLLDLWKYEKVNRFTYTSDFDLQALGKEKIIVYVILPVADKQYNAISSMFFNQLFQELYALADSNYNELPVPVRLLLDEFANIGKIPSFTERLSTTRSYKIEVSIGIQDIGQLREMYGENETGSILGNCDFTLFMGTNSNASAEYFSKLLGTTTKRIKNETANKSDRGGSEGESFSYISRPLRTPDELRRMKEEHPEQCILIVSGKTMFLKKPFYFKFKPLKAVLEPKVNREDYPYPDRTEYFEFTPPPKEEEPPLEIEREKEKERVAAFPQTEQLLAETNRKQENHSAFKENNTQGNGSSSSKEDELTFVEF
jgi:type IV secretion system protein VirD4